VPHYGGLEVPPGPEDIGPENGLTLDGAIERLLNENLNLLALRYEIPMAKADVLTASLRNNPIFYADSQLVPYGHYSNHRPGGQTQYDVNVTFPLDVWRKRKARTVVAERAQRVTEAQFQDAIRLQVDNLYTVYVDVVAADETLRFSKVYAKGISELLRFNIEKLKQGEIPPSQTDALRAQVELAELQVREATNALAKATRALALILNISSAQAATLEVRAALQDFRPLPSAPEELIKMAMDNRPDLLAFRMGLQRAQADLHLARANRYSDVYLLYQPYTLQDNRPLGLSSAYSYAVGATVSLPVYNRNQGNIQRSALNVDQSKIELTAQERQVIYDVEEGVRDFQMTLNAVQEIKREVLPAAKRVRDTAYRQWQAGETSIIEYLEAQKDYNETVRHYRDALVEHRRDMLDLNTDVGVRVMP
jgi:cobalt-zinc-cadmium efflux system outer membrane protein